MTLSGIIKSPINDLQSQNARYIIDFNDDGNTNSHGENEQFSNNSSDRGV